MQYIKATKEQCQAYNNEVTQGEKYKGTTIKWADVQEIEGLFYVALHPKYSTNLDVVNSLPAIPSPLIQNNSQPTK